MFISLVRSCNKDSWIDNTYDTLYTNYRCIVLRRAYDGHIHNGNFLHSEILSKKIMYEKQIIIINSYWVPFKNVHIVLSQMERLKRLWIDKATESISINVSMELHMFIRYIVNGEGSLNTLLLRMLNNRYNSRMLCACVS